MATTKEIAEQIARPAIGKVAPAIQREMVDAIEAALRERDERVVRFVENEIAHHAQELTERGDEGRDILNYTDFIKGSKTTAQDILAAIRRTEEGDQSVKCIC